MQYKWAERLNRVIDRGGAVMRFVGGLSDRSAHHHHDDEPIVTDEALDEAAVKSRRAEQRFFDGLDQQRHGRGHTGWG